jgi:molybdopterin-containing oxidoreductase family iron-sulfur binding subunit
LLTDYSTARWHQYEPTGSESATEGNKIVFGEGLQPLYDLEQADVIVALDADFLVSGPGSLAHARAFAKRRIGELAKMNRLYAVASLLTPTGTTADHRLPVKSALVEAVLLAIAITLGVPGVNPGPALTPE